MSRVDDESMLGPTVRTMQIIIAAPTSGLVFFLGIVLFLSGRPGLAPPRPAVGPAPSTPMISDAAVGFAAMAVPMSLLIPRAVAANGRKQIARETRTSPLPGTDTPPRGPPATRTSRLAAVYLTSLIIGAALNEGPAVFALIAYMLEGLPAILGVAILLILGVAARFPTRAGVERWIEDQGALLLLEPQARESRNHPGSARPR